MSTSQRANDMIDILNGTFHRAVQDEETVERLLTDLRDLEVADRPPMSVENQLEDTYFEGDLESEIPEKYSIGDIKVVLNHTGLYHDFNDDIEAEVSFHYGRKPVLAMDNIAIRNIFGGSRTYRGVLDQGVDPETEKLNRTLRHYNLVE